LFLSIWKTADKGAAREYALARYGMEVQRLCSVLENHLKERSFMVGEEYTIADIAIFPWFQQLRTGYIHSSGIAAKDFLSVEENYPHAVQWAERILARPAVQRGMQVCMHLTISISCIHLLHNLYTIYNIKIYSN
jgi:GSH-dependent disulfide-bond oxidoreductase